jgi:hypothetical protein
VAGAQVVERDGSVARAGEELGGVAADVAGAAGDQDGGRRGHDGLGGRAALVTITRG